ncbi:TPA: restriction endonuclease subunit S [Escherichia coli]|uniref:restriction endonuclease subunit S n=1 Tax=Escherichia coli TaxID=562 RepID=UPI0006936CDE|nr:restriction endonuclease subunit S [Escherichia coli]EEW1688933.1 restriction endonuclease subunit S [Escherichia coli]EFH6232906.1 restriction endonuclease subunit S [Escherichia coli]EGZ8535544.1 restriction endonuclease subunit S [Escherichia coli]HAN4995594.1 restriction endonuclease subunit S [Escherichia coli]
MGSKITLAEICTDISYGYTASATAKPVGPKFLRITDIQGGKVNWENVPYCEIDEKDSLKYLLQDGDIVIARTGNSTGENFIFSSNTKVVFASYLIRFRIDPKKANPKFIWLQMRTPQWWSFIDSVKTGSAQAGANAKVLGLYEVELPERKIQDHIADIGFNLLKKQDINSKINQTLEQMSQTLFKSWFVDFDPVIDNALDAGNPIPEALQTRTKLRQKVRNSADFKPLPAEIRSLFPSEFEETELGWVPKGWDVVKTEDIAIKIGMGPFGSNIKASQFVSSGIPIINGQQLKGLILEKNFINYITDEHANILKNSLVYEHDIVLTHRGTLGQVSLIPKRKGNEKFVISQSQFYLRVDRKKCSPFYMIHFLKSRIGQEALLSNASQVGVPSIARPSTHLKKITFINPPLSLHKLFDNEFEVILEKIMNCKEQSLALTALRDTLLPKLISGELSLEDLPDLTTDTEAA